MRQAAEIFRNSEEKANQHEALTKILTICRRMRYFCRQVVAGTEDRAAKALFVEMFRSHNMVVLLLKPLVQHKRRPGNGADNSCHESLLSEIALLKVPSLKQSRVLTGSGPISQGFINMQNQLIGQLRKLVREIKTRKLRQELSSQIAVMQLVLDQMKLLNDIKS